MTGDESEKETGIAVIPSEQESPTPKNGLERYLSTLEMPRPGESELAMNYKRDYEIWDAKLEELYQSNVDPTTYRAELDAHELKRPQEPEGILEAYKRSGNEVLRELLPTVVENCRNFISKYPTIEITPDNNFEYLDHKIHPD